MSSTVWRPSKPVAYLIALLSIWPIVYFALFIAFIVFSFSMIPGNGKPGGGPPHELFMYIFPMHLLTMLLMFALTAVYIVHVFKSDQLASDRRIMWTMVLLFG